jgi:hypothetical protein
MDGDERAVCDYLKSCPGQFVSGREVARRATGRRRFETDPDWAVQILFRLVDQRVIESDCCGHYRFPQPKTEKTKRRWISPQVQRLLDASGRNFGGTVTYDLGEADAESLEAELAPSEDPRGRGQTGMALS